VRWVMDVDRMLLLKSKSKRVALTCPATRVPGSPVCPLSVSPYPFALDDDDDELTLPCSLPTLSYLALFALAALHHLHASPSPTRALSAFRPQTQTQPGPCLPTVSPRPTQRRSSGTAHTPESVCPCPSIARSPSDLEPHRPCRYPECQRRASYIRSRPSRPLAAHITSFDARRARFALLWSSIRLGGGLVEWRRCGRRHALRGSRTLDGWETLVCYNGRVHDTVLPLFLPLAAPD
jgi:hypothetical protein